MYEKKEVKNEFKMVVFKLGDEEFGAPIHQVHEILRLVEITRVPRAPKFIEGVINLRGRIIPIIDLALILLLSLISGTGLNLVRDMSREPKTSLPIFCLNGIILSD